MVLAPNWISAAAFKQPMAKPFSAWVTHGPFAFWLVEQHRPRRIVELGTHNGYSYLCMCQQSVESGLAMQATAIDTWRGDEHAGFYDESVYRSLKAWHDPKYASFSKLLRASFDEALPQFEEDSIDLLHIDGRHFYDDVKHDFLSWLPKLSPRGIVMFHDTQVRDRGFGVWKLWRELRALYPSFEFHHGHGLGVLCVGREAQANPLPIFAADLSDVATGQIRQTYARLGGLIESGQTLRRNDECPCGSGARFKHCHGQFI